MFQCLAALKVDRLKSDCSNMKTLVELKEEEEEQGDEEEADEEVFSLELERGERGIGLALIDTRVSQRQFKLQTVCHRASRVYGTAKIL